MTIPAIHELDPLEELKALRQRVGDDPLAQLKDAQRRPSQPGMAADATRALPSSRENASGDFEATAPSVLGTLASPLRHIPGADAVAAAVRAGVRGQSYRQARNDIHDAVDEAPKALTVPLQAGGAALSALALPGSMMAQGASHGALNSALDSDPDRGIGSRAAGATIGGLTEGALGAAGMAAGALRNAPKGALREVAGELMPDKITKAAAKWRSLRSAVEPVAAKALPSPVVGTITPQTEGLIGNGMDNVLEAVKARGAPSPDVVRALRDQPLYDAFSNEARAVDQATGHALPDVVKATQRYRTESGRLQQGAPQARFEWWAERTAKRKP